MYWSPEYQQIKEAILSVLTNLTSPFGPFVGLVMILVKKMKLIRERLSHWVLCWQIQNKWKPQIKLEATTLYNWRNYPDFLGPYGTLG